MINIRDVNIAMIAAVARHLGELREKVVFVGGCATGFFISDPAMPEVRATQDVDVIVEVASRLDYYRLEEELRQRGFKQDMTENAPVCRWLVDRTRSMSCRPRKRYWGSPTAGTCPPSKTPPQCS